MPANDTLRTSDAERDQTVAALSDHFALGRLSLDELNRRVDRALRATTRAELSAVVADLPPQQPSPANRWVWPLWAPWTLTGVICLIVWLATSVAHGGLLYFWPIWVIGPWGASLAAAAAKGAVRGGQRPRGSGCCLL